jgi:hypothetical protein
MSETQTMTIKERELLSRAIRMREKVAKSELEARAAKGLLEFEAHIQAQYSYSDDAVWNAAMEQAQPIIDEAKRVIAQRARELGIPARFAPTLTAHWSGQATVKDERSELRRLAASRIAEMVARGRVQIETEAARLQVELISGAIGSAEGQAFLERIPSADALVPAISAGDVKLLLTVVTEDEDRKAHPWRYGIRAVEQRAAGDKD